MPFQDIMPRRVVEFDLHRSIYLPECTPGVLSDPADCGAYICSTLELPNLNNARRKSCIPAGTYTAKMRKSATMKRVSGGRWDEAFELQDVPDRDFILMHPGNYPKNSHGCILVGGAFAYWGKEKGYAVPNSRMHYQDLLHFIDEQTDTPDEIVINIHEPDPVKIAAMISGT